MAGKQANYLHFSFNRAATQDLHANMHMQVAFSSISTALRLYASDLVEGRFHIHHGVIEKKAGAPPNDPAAFQLKNHFAIPTAISSKM